MKDKREAERAAMRAEIKAKAKKNIKHKPSFEVMEIPEAERERG